MAKIDENSSVSLGATFGEGNIPINGAKSGFVVSYIQTTNGAIVDAPSSFNIILNPNKLTTTSVTTPINLTKNLDINILLPKLYHFAIINHDPPCQHIRHSGFISR